MNIKFYIGMIITVFYIFPAGMSWASDVCINGEYAVNSDINIVCTYTAASDVRVAATGTIRLLPGFHAQSGSRVRIGDNDGMDDLWEYNNFGGDIFADPGGDFDGDGITNISEYHSDTFPNGDLDGDTFTNRLEELAGTDPNDPADAPKTGSYYDYDELGRIKNIYRVQ